MRTFAYQLTYFFSDLRRHYFQIHLFLWALYFHCAIDYNVGSPLEANIGNLQGYEVMFHSCKIIIMKFYCMVTINIYCIFLSMFSLVHNFDSLTPSKAI